MKPFNRNLFTALTLAILGSAQAQAVSPSPYKLVEEGILGLPLTNSMVMSWVVSILIILLVRKMVKKPTLVPHTGQAIVESFVGGLKDLFEPIVGKQMIMKVFPLLIGLFVFILIHNRTGLLPGVGAFGFYGEDGLKYWMRPGNADLNMTIALAIISAVGAWGYFVFRYAGAKTLLYDLFGNKAEKSEVPGPIYLFLFVIFFAVGLIEIVSILFRPVSLSFRLFGNVFGGENLLANMSELANGAFLIPFYGLELLIGLVQALVFALLTAVYIGLICNHGDEEQAH